MTTVTEKTFAEKLKEARRLSGLSQSALARRAGLTGSYISVLESRRRRPPSPRVIRALCRALGIEDGPLQEAAALERSPAPVRRHLERMQRESGQVQRSRDRILATTLFHLARGPRVVEPLSHFLDLGPGQQALVARLLGRLGGVKNVDEAEARSETLLEGTTPAERNALVRVLPSVLAHAPSPAPATAHDGAPAPVARADVALPVVDDPDRSGAGEVVHVDRAVLDGARWLWRATCDDGHPRVEAGDLVGIDPEREPEDGDLVLLRHEARLRLGVWHRQADWVRLSFPRPEIPPLRIAANALVLLGVARLVLRRLT